MKTIAETIDERCPTALTPTLHYCSEHDAENNGRGCAIVYNHTVVGNSCPVCAELEEIEGELDQVTENEETANKEAAAASNKEAAATKRALELAEKLSTVTRDRDRLANERRDMLKREKDAVMKAAELKRQVAFYKQQIKKMEQTK